MVSAAYDRTGTPVARAADWGTVAVADVDVGARTRWVGLGDFAAGLPRHRPVAVGEPRVE